MSRSMNEDCSEERSGEEELRSWEIAGWTAGPRAI